MDTSSLGDRMKRYERAYNTSFPIRLPLMLRLDGVHFHTNVKKWNCEKPFDPQLIDAMANAAKYLCESISGAHMAYVQSDEISILVRDDMGVHSQPWYSKEINKIMSVAAAKASNAFNSFYEPANDLNRMAEFDCRGFVLPEYEIENAFIWRQQDYTRNSIQMLARSVFSHNKLNKKNNSQIQDMLMLEKNINWNDLDIHLKRGICIVKKTVEMERDGNRFMRLKWVIDKEIPIFTADRDYIHLNCGVHSPD